MLENELSKNVVPAISSSGSSVSASLVTGAPSASTSMASSISAYLEHPMEVASSGFSAAAHAAPAPSFASSISNYVKSLESELEGKSDSATGSTKVTSTRGSASLDLVKEHLERELRAMDSAAGVNKRVQAAAAAEAEAAERRRARQVTAARLLREKAELENEIRRFSHEKVRRST